MNFKYSFFKINIIKSNFPIPNYLKIVFKFFNYDIFKNFHLKYDI